jgi:hypothetical protein
MQPVYDYEQATQETRKSIVYVAYKVEKNTARS